MNIVKCNSCGKKIKTENGLLVEDAFEAAKDWGYFSKKDLERHKFVLCEKCYDRITSEFIIPVTKIRKTEAI